MIYTYKNITGSTAQELLDYSELKNKTIKCINLCNVHASDSVLVDLYLYKKPSSNYSPSYDDHADVNNETITNLSYYILKNTKIPYGSTLQLEASDFLIDKNITQTLYIKLNASDSAVDVIIKN
jgi:hypothetical protein